MVMANVNSEQGAGVSESLLPNEIPVVPMEFLRSNSPYTVGETAGIPVTQAERLEARGIAVRVGPPRYQSGEPVEADALDAELAGADEQRARARRVERFGAMLAQGRPGGRPKPVGPPKSSTRQPGKGMERAPADKQVRRGRDPKRAPRTK